MATKNEQDTVVGVFLDEAQAQRAVQALQNAGLDAQVSDSSGIGKMGLDRETANLFNSRASEGNSIVTVNAPGKGDQAMDIMLQNGAENINFAWNQGGYNQTTSTTTTSTGYTANDYAKMAREKRQYGQIDQTTGRGKTAEEMKVQLREETLTPVKSAQQAGEVQLRKVVHEKEQEVPVNLTREQVYIERTPVDRAAQPGELDNFQDEVIRVPVYEERAELQKQGRVREEVRIGKEAQQEQQNLKGTTRHEHLEVEQSGDVEVRGDAKGTVRDYKENNRDADYDRNS